MQVEPVLAAAEEALGALQRNDIVEIKTFTRPPALVQRTMEAVCILLREPSDWDGAKRVLSDAGFQKRLLEFDRDAVTAQMLSQLEPIASHPSFAPDPVGRQSKAAMGMCMWVRLLLPPVAKNQDHVPHSRSCGYEHQTNSVLSAVANVF